MNRCALSIRQPYASQIMNRTKKIEYRSRPTHIRERVYIYASLGLDEEYNIPRYQKLPRGVLIGTVEVGDCIYRRGRYEWHLARPRRALRKLKPRNQPQPGWFYPF